MAGLRFSTALRTARGERIVAAIDAGAGPGTMAFYTAPVPATGGAVTSQTLLGTVAFGDPSGTVADGITTMNALTDDTSADATGDAAWVRIYDGAGAFVADLDVTDNAGAGPVKMASVSIIQGGVIAVTAFTVTEGNL